MRFLPYFIILLFGLPSKGADQLAAGLSTAQVQTAVDAASDGDRVLLPDGDANWTAGITTTKQLQFQAQNYTPTSGGTATRSVNITNNSSGPLLALQSGNTYHVGVGGIAFREGSADVNAVRFTGSGSKPPLLWDCYFENRARFGSAEDIAVVTFLSLGAVCWNIRMDGTPFGSAPPGDAGPSIASISWHFKSPRSWETDGTMGAADTGGNINIYVEDSTFLNTGTIDLDDNSRGVFRNSTFDGSIIITHGFTSTWGGRHFEFYNNTFSVTYEYRNHAGRYFWCRAGTGVFTDNVVNNSSFTGSYGSVNQLHCGDNTVPTAYLQDRQMGCGYEGGAYVSEPIYLWNQTGARAYNTGIQSGPEDWTGNVQVGRDIIANSGAKPGFSKFTYPQPFRSAVMGGGGSSGVTGTRGRQLQLRRS